MHEILVRCQYATWDARADHKLIGLFLACCLARLPLITVLLLIHAVKLDELNLILREAWALLLQFFRDLPL